MPQDVSSFYTAVESATEGTIIEVQSTYVITKEESNRVGTGVCLGANKVTIRGDGSVRVPAIRVEIAVGVVIEGLTLDTPALTFGACPSGEVTDGDDAHSLWLVGAEVTLDGITLDGEVNPNFGALIKAEQGGTFIGQDLTVTDNRTKGENVLQAGGLREFTLSGSTITGNTAGFYLADTLAITLDTCTFEHDAVASTSAADLVVVGAGTFTVVDSTFKGSGAGTYGSVFLSNVEVATFSGGTFSGTTAPSFGGAVAMVGGSLSFSGTTFADTSAEQGGAIWATGTDVVLNTIYTTSSRASLHGGFLAMGGGDLLVSDSTFQDSTADGLAHALGLQNVQGSILSSTFCTGGTAESGAIHTVGGTLRVEGSGFQGLEGAGIHVEGYTGLAVLNSDFVADAAGVRGEPGELDLINVLCAHNGVGVDLLAAPTGEVRVGWSLWYGNDVDRQGSPLTLVGDNPTTDPLFVNGYRPETCGAVRPRVKAGSPVIDAGDPEIFDVDGSRSDIGAFGGPNPMAEDGVVDPGDSGDSDPRRLGRGGHRLHPRQRAAPLRPDRLDGLRPLGEPDSQQRRQGALAGERHRDTPGRRGHRRHRRCGGPGLHGLLRQLHLDRGQPEPDRQLGGQHLRAEIHRRQPHPHRMHHHRQRRRGRHQGHHLRLPQRMRARQP